MSEKNLLAFLKKYKTFLISTHVNPDIDALASEIVTALFLKSLGKKVFIVNADAVPKMYRFLPFISLVQKKGNPLDYDAAVIVDCGELDRIDTVQKILLPGKPIVNIDHHITNDYFGRVNYVQPKASSTAEVLYGVLKKERFSFTKETAALLYLGIMTDTGSFRYDNTTDYTHTIASHLLTFKIPVNDLYRRIYETIPLKDVQSFLKIANSFQMIEGGKVLYVELNDRLTKGFSGEFDIREKIFSFLRAIKGVCVIAIFTEVNKNLTRVNFRSQSKVDVAKLASFFGGGGHTKASGCRISANISKAKQQIFGKLRKLM